MKSRIVRCCLEAALVLFLIFISAGSLVAQGTAFNYQGRLLVNSNSANGNYDMQFKLHPAANVTNLVGSPIGLSPVGVTNGLFMVTLDFGNVYDGSSLWLEIDVRPTGSSSNYSALNPTQPINPVPYAVTAESATAYSGTVQDYQLSGNVALFGTGGSFTAPVSFTNASGNFNGNLSGTFNGAASGTFSGTGTGTFNGTFNGNGAGVTNVNVTNLTGLVQSNPNWQVVQATSQTLTNGNNYLSTNSVATTLTLPANPDIGSIVRISGSGANGVTILPNSGQSILTAPLNLPAGQIWNQQATSLGKQAWRALAMSASGMRVAAGVGYGAGNIYYSADGGNTWAASDAPLKNWYGIATSADGMRMVAAPVSGNLYTSTNGGVNWIAQTLSASTSWTCVASSADGVNLVAGVGSGSGYVYTSSNAGSNWTQRTGSGSQNWAGVACSSNGTTIVAVPSGSAQIMVSYNEGATWTNVGPASSTFSSVACSGDGSKMIASVSTGYLYTSGDGGLTWNARGTNVAWSRVASSANGYNLAAVYNTGYIFTSSDSGQTWLPRTNINGTNALEAWTCLASSADGSRLITGINTGYLYNTIAQTTPGTGSVAETQYSCIELQYIGNGQWIPLTRNGSFTAN